MSLKDSLILRTCQYVKSYGNKGLVNVKDKEVEVKDYLSDFSKF